MTNGGTFSERSVVYIMNDTGATTTSFRSQLRGRALCGRCVLPVVAGPVPVLPSRRIEPIHGLRENEKWNRFCLNPLHSNVEISKHRHRRLRRSHSPQQGEGAGGLRICEDGGAIISYLHQRARADVAIRTIGLRHPELEIRTPAHTKQLWWYV